MTMINSMVISNIYHLAQSMSSSSPSSSSSSSSSNSQATVPTNSTQVADFVLNNIIFQKFGDILKEDFKISVKSIMGLILLLSMNGLKSACGEIFTNMVPFLKQSPQYILQIALWLSKLIPFRRPALMVKSEEQILDSIIEIEADEVFLRALYVCIHKNKCDFIKTVSGVNIANMKDRYLIEKICNIRINNVTITNSLIYNISMISGEPMNKSQIIKSKNHSEIKTYADLFNEKHRKMIIKNLADFQNNCSSSTRQSLKQMTNSNGNDEKYAECILAKAISQNYPQFEIEDLRYQIGVFSSLLKKIINLDNTTRDVLEKKNILLFDVHNKYNYDDIVKNGNTLNFLYCDNFGSNIYTSDKVRKAFGDFVKGIPFTNDDVITNKLQIKIADSSEIETKAELEAFVNDVYKYQKNSEASVKIYYLIQEIETETIEKPNPAYEGWLEKKKIMDEFKNTTDKFGMQKVNVDLSNVDIPTKTITIETSRKVIVEKFLNESKKNLDTLYLRKNDKARLLNSLYQFKNKKETLKSLGLQNKLNALLYGEPGTGKSSTIVAIATYLERDIYYLDLKKAVTNNDLQMLIEYVNKNVQNGGIIVIEDIDAMTNVVLKRENSIEARVSELANSSDNALTLEYLLNILQGTLTMDDSVFIVTTNHLEHLDPAFYRDGRFDVRIELKLCDHHQIQEIYQKLINRSIPHELLQKLPEDTFAPATIIACLKDYIFNTDADDAVILQSLLDPESQLLKKPFVKPAIKTTSSGDMIVNPTVNSTAIKYNC